MTTHVFRFRFASGVDLAEAESTLHLAILAVEGLFGEARVRMEVSYCMDAPRSALLIDGGSTVGDAVIRIFTAFLTREFGAGAFSVRRVAAATRICQRDRVSSWTAA
ncbi:MAG: hypothetical protein EA376_00645 [Phycisphaeraceae bacterium]|nr:MAG: hypothetical protein EA376_00645 [Phycisphaeraceae bacterium]